MYDRFTDRARKVMQLAKQEAQRFNHEYLGTEHILLGLVRDGSGVAANVLKNLDMDLRKIGVEVEKIVQIGPDRVVVGQLPQTPRAKKVIEYAIAEARELRHNYVGSEHLLLGLLREEEGVAAQVLMNLGVNLDVVRTEVFDLLGTGCAWPLEYRVVPEANLAQCPEPTDSIQQALDQRIEQLAQEKEAAVAEQDFERAAFLRDRADRLKKQREAHRRERRQQRRLHPVDPSWLSWNNGTALTIARVIREDRRWTDFPILADALEDAGCTDGEMLRHCRQGGAHSRHCWVLDLLLGER
jgi:ATP-dependent Clp protease ATP-binding subunit ClpA